LSLLHEALGSDPDKKLARWQLGEVKMDDKWVSVEEAQRLAAADPLLAKYRESAAKATATVPDQLALARWCRDNKLDDEAQLHWSVALSIDPKNKEALRAVDMAWKDGRLVKRSAPTEQKQQSLAFKNAAKYWEPIIAKWRRAVAGRDVKAHDAALAEISSLRELEVIPFIEAVTLGRDANNMKHAEECLQIAVAFVESLSKMPDQAATESLVRHAVFPPGNKARLLAAEKLKPRDKHDYVPILLGALGMPIETSFQVTTDAGGNVRYTHSLYREGEDSDWSYDVSKASAQRDLGSLVTLHDTYTGKSEVGRLAEAPVFVEAKKAAIASKAQNRFAQNAIATESQVAHANETSEQMNSRIIPVLTTTTGKDFGDNPKAWWDWWRGDNEYYADDHEVERRYETEVDHTYYGFPQVQTYSTAPPPPPLPPGRRRSCFAKGTPVWTKTGKKPIEAINLGEFVLSQNVNTGELSYKPVLVTTVRPPSPMLNIELGNDHLVTTLGHPFWISGVGWRMAKELGDDAMLHGVTGASRIKSSTPAKDAEAYNLVVADFNTYFVGNSGVLVHDNTPRQSAQVVVPGVAVQ
jgi:hypothetical protein